MSSVCPKRREQPESPEIDLMNKMLSRDVRPETLGDLIVVPERIVAEKEGRLPFPPIPRLADLCFYFDKSI